MAKTTIIETSVFTNNAGITFQQYTSGKFAKVEPKADGKSKTTPIKQAEYEAEKAAHEAWLATQNPADNKDDGADKGEGTPEPKTETPKTKKHPTADAFLAKMPANTYVFERNNKGHIRIFKADGDKTAYAKLCPKKEGVNICPSKALREAQPEVAWEYHEGWASKYAYKAADWDEVATILNLDQA